jgi:hypothetical protein
MLLELTCIGILYKCIKKVIDVNKPNNFTQAKGSAKPAEIIVEEPYQNVINKERSTRGRAPIIGKGFKTYDEIIRENLRRKIKKEHWKEMGLED